MRLKAACLAAALVVLHAPCALLDAGAGPRGADAQSCAAGVCGAAPALGPAARRLLLEGWEEATTVMAPQFVELVPAGAPGAVATRRRFAHAGCADRPEWRFLWPMSLTEGWTCGDYAAGALNHDYCDTDLGYDFVAGEWLAARRACPVACGACCDVSAHCDGAPDAAACREECRTAVAAPMTITAGGTSHTLTDPYERYLAHVDAKSNAPADAGDWAMFQQHASGVDSALTVNETVLEVVPFQGGTFMDEKEVRVFSSTPLSKVRYTTDGTAPSATLGTVGATVRVERNALVHALGYMPRETGRTMAASDPSSVSINVKASPPSLSVVECVVDSGQTLTFNASFPYANQTCILAMVLVQARAISSTLVNSTVLRYSINQPDPGTSNPQVCVCVCVCVCVRAFGALSCSYNRSLLCVY